MMESLALAILASAMVALPARATVSLRRRGRAFRAPWRRLALAVLAATIALAAPLALGGASDRLLSAHMLQHVLIGDLAPLLLVLAIRGPLLLRLLPRAAMLLARRLGAGHLLAVATRPAVAFAFWAASLAVWHVPALYERALERAPLHALEHASFLVSGLLVWSVLLDPAHRRALPGWGRFGYALALLAVSGLLANVLILSYRPLYPSYAAVTSRPFGLTPVGDQGLAALVMMLEQLATLGTFAILSARRQLLAPAAEPRQRHPLAV